MAVLPVDDPLIAAQATPVARERRLTFGGAERGATFGVLEVIPAGAGGSVVRYAVRGTPVVVRLPLGGAHNARNGAAALAVALAAGVSPVDAARALETLALPPHRSAPVAAGGRIVLDDCYNANPAAMSAALGALVAAAGRRRRASPSWATCSSSARTPRRRTARSVARPGSPSSGLVAVGRARAGRRRGGARGGPRPRSGRSSRRRPRRPPRRSPPGRRPETGCWSRRLAA